MRNIHFTTFLSTLMMAILPTMVAASQQPTVEEQVLLERVNAARLHQAEESRRLNVDFQEGMNTRVNANLQPLIWRAGMQEAATEHNQDMWTRGYYGHVTPDGRAPFAQVQAHDSNYLAVGQNLGAGRMFTSPDAVYAGWMIDAGIENRGHRQTILHSKINAFGAQRSSSANTFYGVYWTAYFGVMMSETAHVTGVIYRDLNRNGRYDEGEGQANWKVRLIAQSPAAETSQPISQNAAAAAAAATEPEFTAAYATGGYALPVPAEGDYTIEAVSSTGESFFATAGVGEDNVKVDFVIDSTTVSAAATAPAAGGSSRKAGCAVTLPSNTAWHLLLVLGALCAAILGLRVAVR